MNYLNYYHNFDFYILHGLQMTRGVCDHTFFVRIIVEIRIFINLHISAQMILSILLCFVHLIYY